MSTKRPGEQELALLTWLAERPATTVGEVADGYAVDRGLARSTVLTMMERLRKKGHLSRKQVDGLYRYATRTAPGDAVQHAVASFVDRTLGGSVTPFVTFLAEAHQVSDAELAELEELVAKLQGERRRSS
jgi:predicted transcriptional regulator